MNVVFSKVFKKDILKLKQKLKSVILQLEKETSLKTIVNCTRIKGHSSAYRIRTGNYRLGIYNIESEIQIARFAKRNDIYKLFP